MRHDNVIPRRVKDLKPYGNNPRKHSKKQIRQIAKSIEEFGFTTPLLIDPEGTILAGHGRALAAELLDLEEVPTLCLEGLTEAQKSAYVIADNKIGENSEWDPGLLKIEFENLLEFDTDLSVTGFDMGEIDGILGFEAEEEEAAPPEPQTSMPAVSKVGDVWLLSEHKLMCGDARKSEDYASLLDGEKADLVFADSPYNVKIDGHVCGKGSVRHGEFVMASGEMSETEFQNFLTDICAMMASHTRDGSIHYLCMDFRHAFEMLTAGRKAYSELKNICVWNKSNAGMGSLYRSRHEFVFVFKNGTAPHINNVQLGKHGRHRSNVWSYAGINTFGKDRLKDLALHPTVKPTRLVADAILDCSNRGDLILDPFMGSGTTLLAAQDTGRRCVGLELNPHYVDVAVRRFESVTGIEAVHSVTGLGFAEHAARTSDDASTPTTQARDIIDVNTVANGSGKPLKTTEDQS
jgi:DNA modification methylase